MATGTIKNELSIARISQNASVSASAVIGGYYSYLNLTAALQSLLGTDWESRVLAVIPLGAVSTSSNGLGGGITQYNSSEFRIYSWALFAPAQGTYRCDFEVLYR